MAALICLLSLITIPFAVPITLQTFGIYFALFFLGARRGFVATLLYIAIGAVGIPVFSGFSGGISRLFDATGGYIFGFIILALIYWLITALLPRNNAIRLIAAAISLVFLYTVGTLWYALVYLGGTEDVFFVLSVCVLPFILPDAIKIVCAHIAAERLKRIIKL